MLSEQDVANITFEQLVAGEGVSHQDVDDTHTLVRMLLFSRFPRRKQYALIELQRYWDAQVGVKMRKEGEFTLSYVKLGPESPYFLIGKYSNDGPTFESIPGEDEKARWPPE